MRHLEDPARLVHRVGMHEGDDRPGSAHPLVVQRPVDVIGHKRKPLLATLQWYCQRSNVLMIVRLRRFANRFQSGSAAGPLADKPRCCYSPAHNKIRQSLASKTSERALPTVL